MNKVISALIVLLLNVLFAAAQIDKENEPPPTKTVKQTESAKTFERKQIKLRVNRSNLTVRTRGSIVTGDN